MLKNNFKEKSLPPSFSYHAVESVKKLISESQTFSIAAVPSMGLSIFLRYLAAQKFAYFIHIDMFDLSDYTRNALFKELGHQLNISRQTNTHSFSDLLEQCKKKLSLLTDKNTRVVLIFNHFEDMKSNFTPQLFENLRSLRDIDKEKVVMIFAVNKSLIEIQPKAFMKGLLTMYGKTYYLSLYSPNDLQSLLILNSPHFLSSDRLTKAIRLSGGHYQLLQLILRSDLSHSQLLIDPAIRLQLQELHEYLSYSQRSTVQKIVLGKKIQSLDPYLVKIGFIKSKRDTYHLFSPLFTQHISENIKISLPVKEAKIYKVLKKKLGKVVSKEELFSIVWGESTENASDWALNALIYRLRKNPTFQSSPYIIESHKKVGYRMVRK